MKWDREGIREGMLVTSSTGERIGKVIRCDAETFVVEKGTLFPKDFELRYDHITDVKADGSITYSLAEYLEREKLTTKAAEPTKLEKVAAALGVNPEGRAAEMTEERLETKEERLEAEEEGRLEAEGGLAAAEGGLAAKETRAESRTADQEIHIPLLKEELDIEKFAYESGRVKIHKGVKVEERHFTVPVRREEVIVEHVSTREWEPATSMSATKASTAFEDQTMDIPLYEEDIRVGKHPVVREEVVIRTVSHAVDVEGSASLRSEEAEIEDTRRRPGVSASAGNSSPTGYGAPGRR